MTEVIQVRNRHGRTYNVQTHANGDLHHCVERSWKSGIYQVTSLRYMRDLVPNARRIIDVGANVGTNTLEYATWAKTVEAFECNDINYQCLVDNIALNRKTHGTEQWYKRGNASLALTAEINVHNMALMDRAGWAYVTHKEAGLADYVNFDRGDSECIVDTIDNANWQDVDAIKLDTEGTEWLIVQGAKATIERCRPVVQVEMWGWEKRFKLNNQDMLDYFKSLNYRYVNNKGEDLDWNTPGKIPRTMDRFFVPR